jgi:hypothetical protein
MDCRDRIPKGYTRDPKVHSPFRIYKLDKRKGFADVHDTEAKEMVYSRTVAGGANAA